MNYFLEPVIGICRFSFCGNGDWAAYSGVDKDTDLEALRKEQAKVLYDDTRMGLRFYLFENFLLPSLKAQKDPNYMLIVLTSDIMPAKHLTRLRKICEADPRLILVVSSETNVHDALMPEIKRLNAGLSKPLVQFRIDDDDCLSTDYVHELRSYMLRLGDVMPVSYSRSTGLVVTSYKEDGQTNIYRANLPYNAMGTAIRVHGERTIFSFGHGALLRRFPAMVNNGGMGFISIKIDGHDSRPINMNEHAFRRTHALLDEENTNNVLSKWFEFIGGAGPDRRSVLVARIEAAAGLLERSAPKTSAKTAAKPATKTTPKTKSSSAATTVTPFKSVKSKKTARAS